MGKDNIFMKAFKDKIDSIVKYGGMSPAISKILNSMYDVMIDQSNTIKKDRSEIKDLKKIVMSLESNLIKLNKFYNSKENKF